MRMDDGSPANGNCFACDLPAEKVPMHPEDYAALLAWVRAKGEG